MRCPDCPVPAGRECLGETPRFGAFCAWSASGDPVKIAHVVNRSAITIAEGARPAADSPASLPPPAPTLARRAGYLASAVVAAVKSGAEQVAPEERARRLAICATCEHFDAAAERCGRCTCYMPLKTRLVAWHCPLPEPRW
jgi:hypothetical protein